MGPKDFNRRGPWTLHRSRARSSDSLSQRDREILAFERQWWKYAGAKEQAVRELFDM